MIQHSPEYDPLVVSWWTELCKGGMELAFYPQRMRQLGDFVGYCRSVPLYYRLDERGICAAIWMEPCLDGAFTGLWIAERKRRSPAVVRDLLETLHAALKFYPVIFAITKQERLLRPARRLGFKVLEGYNKLWGDSKAWLLSLTLEDWHGRDWEQGAHRS